MRVLLDPKMVLLETEHFDYFQVGDNVYRRAAAYRGDLECDLYTGAPYGARWECGLSHWPILSALIESHYSAAGGGA